VGIDVAQRELLRQCADGERLGSLKNELIHRQRYTTRAEAGASIREHIEIFYNRKRRYSRLGNIAPARFVEQFNRKLRTA